MRGPNGNTRPSKVPERLRAALANYELTPARSLVPASAATELVSAVPEGAGR